MKKKSLVIVISLFVILLTAILLLRNWTEKIKQVCFESYCFEVELATTFDEISRGLMFKEELGENKGMLFIFPKEGEYSFWMKNTLIPLDIIWINEKKEVVFIYENAQPCQEENFCSSISLGRKAKYVLEINGGMVDKIGLKTGDKITMSIK